MLIRFFLNKQDTVYKIMPKFKGLFSIPRKNETIYLDDQGPFVVKQVEHSINKNLQCIDIYIEDATYEDMNYVTD